MAGLTPETIDAAWRAAPDRFGGLLNLPQFGGPVRFMLWPEDGPAPLVSPALMDKITELLEVFTVEAAIPLLLAHCRHCSEYTDYGFSAPDGDVTGANLRAFGLGPDGAAPEDWYQPSWLRHLSFSSDEFDGDQAYLFFVPPWETEHGCCLRVEGGKLVEFHH